MNDYISKTGHLSKPDLIKGDKKTGVPAPKGDNTFNQLLSERLGKTMPTGEPQKLSALSEIQSPLNIPLTNASFDAKKYSQKLTTSLDLLETYAAFLDNPDKTLKQASELLDQLLNQTQGLEQEFKASNASDPDLNKILTQILTTVTLERIKMDRGDYLN